MTFRTTDRVWVVPEFGKDISQATRGNGASDSISGKVLISPFMICREYAFKDLSTFTRIDSEFDNIITQHNGVNKETSKRKENTIERCRIFRSLGVLVVAMVGPIISLLIM